MGCPHDNIWDHCFTVWQVVTSWEVWADKASKLDSTLQMLEVEAMTIFASTLQEKTEKLTTHAEDTKECWQHCSMPWYGTNFSVNSFLFEGSILGLRSWRSLGTRFSGAKIFQHGSDSSFELQSSSNISAVGPVLGQPLCHQRGGVTTHSPLPWPKIAECLEMLSEISAEISSDISRGFQPAFSTFFTSKCCTFERLDAGREPMPVPFGTKTRHLSFQWFTLVIFLCLCEKCVLVTYVVDTQKNW